MGASPAGLQGSHVSAELAGGTPSGPLVDWRVDIFAGGATRLGSLDDLGLRAARAHSSSSAQQETVSPGPVSTAAPGADALRRLHRSRNAQSARTSSPPLAPGTGAMLDAGAVIEGPLLSGEAPQQDGPGRTGSDGALPGQLPLVRIGSAWSGQPEGVPKGRDAGRPVALELRLPPLHSKLSARLALLAAGGGSLFAGEPGCCTALVRSAGPTCNSHWSS